MSRYLSAALLCIVIGTPAHGADSEEIQVGYGLDQMRLGRDILLVDEAVTRRVNEIGTRIAAHSERPELQFTFRVVNDPQVNAFATSGGFIYINTGLLDFCDSEEELAAVIAHEVTHNTDQHLLKHLENARNEQLTGSVTKFLLEVGGAALIGAVGANNPDLGATGQLRDLGGKVGSLVGTTVVDPATQASILGYKKDQEIEADRRAVKYLIAAGYDPHALIRVFEKMQGLRDKLTARNEPLACGWINKQPGIDERKALVTEWLSKAVD